MVGPTAFAQTASGISYKVRNDAWNGVTALLVGGKRITDVSDDKATGTVAPQGQVCIFFFFCSEE